MARVPGAQRGCSGASQVSECHLVAVGASRSHWCPAKCIAPKRKEGRKEGFKSGNEISHRGFILNDQSRRYTRSLIACAIRYQRKSNVPSSVTSCELPLPSSASTTSDDVKPRGARNNPELVAFGGICLNIRVHQLVSPVISFAGNHTKIRTFDVEHKNTQQVITKKLLIVNDDWR